MRVCAHRAVLDRLAAWGGIREVGVTTVLRALLATTLLMVAAPCNVAGASLAPDLRHSSGASDIHAQVQIPIPQFEFDPKKWVQDAFGALLQELSNGIRAGLDALWAANFITQTPPALTYANESIRAVYGIMRGVANGALALIVTIGALNALARPYFGFTYHSMSAFLPRFILGVILVNTALWWVQFAIDVNNALSATVQDATPPNWNNLNAVHQPLVDIVLGLVYVVVGLLLVIQMLLRLAWIDVLLVISPLAAVCWVLPQTQSWAETWNEQFIGAVFTQFVQVVALKLGGMLVTAVVRLEPDVTWLSFLVGVATLWLTWRIPGLMRAGAGGNIADPIAKALMLRLILRGG
jgi:hypothetical protein